MESISTVKDIKRPVKPRTNCVVITGATAAAMKTAFDDWYRRGYPYGVESNFSIVTAVMYSATEMVIFYYD